MLDWHKNLTEEEKAERSVNIKNAFTEERRKKYSEIMTERNKDMSQESRQKISNFHKDKIISFETREKIGRFLKGKCLGKVVSEETKEKISQANTGRTASAEARLKMKVAHQKFLVKVYKKDELIGEYGYLECQMLFNISVNTIKKLKNTGIVYKEYSFIVEEMAKKKA